MRPIKLIDLQGQYLHTKREIDDAIQGVLNSADFIQGNEVRNFENDLSLYLDGAQVVTCGNGTDGLQISMMTLGLKPGDEVILPVFTYVATAEVIALLGLVPVFVDVDPGTYNLDVSGVEKRITSKTAAIVPVHLFGQCADMGALIRLGEAHGIKVIEDAAQALGATYQFSGGAPSKAGTMGSVGVTSFFPTKNLGAFGDGGAMITRNEELAVALRKTANHGQQKKYIHEIVGVNSRLDTLQAAILRVKLRNLDVYAAKRRKVADFYDLKFKDLSFVKAPVRIPHASHVFHQYTIVVKEGLREKLREYLQRKGVPTAVYYPIPLHFQNAYRRDSAGKGSFPVAESLAESVLSLPVHPELDEEQLSYIYESISSFH